MTTNPMTTDPTVIAARAEYLKALDAYLACSASTTHWSVFFAALEKADLAYKNARRELLDSIRRA